MTYEGAIAYLESVAPFGIKPGLMRMEALLDKLDHPEKAYKSIHITGTNGKGSVSAMVSSALYTSGLKVGTFTSPHLESYTERMRINNSFISEADFARLTEVVKGAVAAIVADGVEQPTQFEILTAMAFLYFKEQEVDYAVVEVGLGGLLDSTNVITPILSIITNVTIDHTAYCGDTVVEIAKHKAGIIKPHVPVITAAQGDALNIIKEVAKEKQSKFYVFNEDFSIDSRSVVAGGQIITVKDKADKKAMLFTTLAGIHQAINLAVAAKAVELLIPTDDKISEETMREGLARATWPGRFEIIKGRNRTFILDGAHNASGAESFALTYQELFKEAPKTVVTAILEDKDVSSIIAQTVSTHDVVITVPAPTPRTMNPETLAKLMPVKATPAHSVAEGMQKALDVTPEGGIIAVCGSLYILGEVKQWLASEIHS